MKRLALCLLPFVAACSGATAAPARPTVLTGLVDATEVDVASKIPGRVKELHVREGDHVAAGQRVVTIESEEIAAKLAQATAATDAARARLRLARAGARAEEKRGAQKALEAAQHQLDIARKTHERVASLYRQSAVPEAAFDEAEFKLNLATSQVAMAQARVDAVLHGARAEEVDALAALVRQGEGALAEVRAYDRETAQAAPLAGEVAKVVLHRGELCATGYPILTIVDLDDVWASFAVREDLLARVQTGTRLTGFVPALGRDVVFQVFTIAPLGDFATWRATSDRGRFDLKSFEVKARPVAPVPGLRPGMTVRWRIEA